MNRTRKMRLVVAYPVKIRGVVYGPGKTYDLPEELARELERDPEWRVVKTKKTPSKKKSGDGGK